MTGAMKLVSTRPPHEEVSLRTAVLDDPAPEGVLYQPVSLPRLSEAEVAGLDGMRFPELAELMAVRILGPLVSEEALQRIVRGAFDFPVPLTRLDGRTRVLELFHGPTGSFKDFGARFLARLLRELREPGEGPVVILVATSGDTGGAVAHAVKDLPDVKAVVLFPKDRVSPVQLRQIQEPAGDDDSPHGGVVPVEIQGSFDDCQRMVKDVLAHPGTDVGIKLTSANSVNVGRLLPQTFYYAFGWASIPPSERDDLVVSVPSGNLGNLTAGILAWTMGIPFGHFVAASNENAAMSRFLEQGRLPDGPSLTTLSSAMDVARPSNLERLLRIYDDDTGRLRARVTPTRHEDDAVTEVMDRVLRERGYLMDPHTAVGYLGLEEVRGERGEGPGLLLATADPAKFPETVIRATGRTPPPRADWSAAGVSPESDQAVRRGEEATVRMGPDPDRLRELLKGLG